LPTIGENAGFVPRGQTIKPSAHPTRLNPATGELQGVAAIYTIEEKDDAEFVNILRS
jgi:hypothetical protein